MKNKQKKNHVKHAIHSHRHQYKWKKKPDQTKKNAFYSFNK